MGKYLTPWFLRRTPLYYSLPFCKVPRFNPWLYYYERKIFLYYRRWRHLEVHEKSHESIKLRVLFRHSILHNKNVVLLLVWLRIS